MLSDPVTNIRRRPGAEYRADAGMDGVGVDQVKFVYTDIAGETVHVGVNTKDGSVSIIDANYVRRAIFTSPYLVAPSANMIQHATVGNELFFCNVQVQPALVPSTATNDPTHSGYWWVVSGAYSKKYEVKVEYDGGGFSGSYTTPGGTGAGDSALATPEYIAQQLEASLNSAAAGKGVTMTQVRNRQYAFITLPGKTNVRVSTGAGSAYMLGSNARYTNVVGNFPAMLAPEADGFIMSVGDTKTPQYYRYDHARLSWLEDGQYGSPSGISNMPISITKDNGVWQLVNDNYEGRFAGDAESNPDPHFIEAGITGMAAYQGRLVLLSGSRVCMSGSNRPRRFFRSTIVTVGDADPIEVGAGGNSSAAYRYAVPFQKDLLLFSAGYQALVPSGNTALTPRNATVVLTSTHATDVTSSPITLGRTLMYAAPKSKDFFGVLEMVPSPYTDSQYVSQDATPHLPKYMGGRCRFAVSSSVSNMALFGPSGDEKSLIVHEYTWDGDTKVQSAFHRWTFPFPVCYAYFASEIIHIAMKMGDSVVLTTIDPRVGVLTFDAERRPFLDVYYTLDVKDWYGQVPAWHMAADPNVAQNATVCAVVGPLAGEKVGLRDFAVDGKIYTVRSWRNAKVAIGYAYTSAISTTPPIARDYNGVAVHTAKQTLLRFVLSTKNSAQFEVLIRDRYSPQMPGDPVGTLYYSSQELIPGRATYATESTATIPCRTRAESTTAIFYTSGTGEFNMIALEYVMRVNQTIRRK